jgi:hypothetical protein
VQNVYINAANKEQICFICGDEEMGTKKAKWLCLSVVLCMVWSHLVCSGMDIWHKL